MGKYTDEDLLSKIIAELLNDTDQLARQESDSSLNSISPTLKEKNVSLNDKDGLLAIHNGQLQLIPPKSGGRWPLIMAGENVSVKINGKEINGAAQVKDTQGIFIEVRQQPPKNNFTLHMSPDLTEVVMETKFTPGNRFRLIDTDPMFILTVKAEPYEEISPQPIDEKMVYDELRSLGVTVGIRKEIITVACNSIRDARYVIACGRAMIPPKDGWIEYMFETKERILTSYSEDEPVDFFDKGKITSVKAGEILAILNPPIPGQPGLTVTGQTILPPEPKVPEIKVGAGASLVNNGQMAVAAQNGRPVLGKQGIIKVIPELVIYNDVDINTGHINFIGNVKIFGNVMEGLVVKAGGQVHVAGSVIYGKIYADSDVIIEKQVIGGVVCAGGEAARYRPMLHLLHKIEYDLQGLIKAFMQLKNNPRFSTSDLRLKGDGTLIKLILDMRYPNLGKNLQELQEIMSKNDEKQELEKLFQLLISRLVGLGPLKIASIDEVIKYQVLLGKIINVIEESIDSPADVSVGYCQNAHVTASGNVKITGEGIFHSWIYAGSKIYLKGFCRGGELFATDEIVAGELGSAKCPQTLVGVGESGKIKAAQIYPNVTVNVGPVIRKNQDYLSNVIFSYEGELVKKLY